jgi:hypothetical protein
VTFIQRAVLKAYTIMDVLENHWRCFLSDEDRQRDCSVRIARYSEGDLIDNRSEIRPQFKLRWCNQHRRRN